MSHRRKTLITADGRTFTEGDIITLDGATGEVLAGAAEMLEPALDDAFQTLLDWADEVRDIGIRANADTPADARMARNFAAAGHRAVPDRAYVLRGRPPDGDARDDLRRHPRGPAADAGPAAADAAQRFHRAVRDHAGPAGLHPPVRPAAARIPAVRPRGPARSGRIAGPADRRCDPPGRAAAANSTRCWGCAACGWASPCPRSTTCRPAPSSRRRSRPAATAHPVVPEIMIPLVSAKREVELVKTRIDAVAAAVRNETGSDFTYRLGVMVETPRACLRADEIARPCGVPQLRHQRPDADDLWPQPRRCRAVHVGLCQPGRLPRGSVPHARHRRGRRTADHRRRTRAHWPARTSPCRSAANMAATPNRLPSAGTPDSTMCRVRRSAFPVRGLPRRIWR